MAYDQGAAALANPEIVRMDDGQSVWNPLRYEPRSCRFLGIGQAGGLTYKLYEIRSSRNVGSPAPRPEALHAAAAEEFGGWESPTDHPLGFAIAHLADDGWYLLLSRWNNANNLRHRVRAIDAGSDAVHARPLDDPHVVACVWELRLMLREADAWIAGVLEPLGETLTPQARERYLAAIYEGPL
jgi:hypothetical protein